MNKLIVFAILGLLLTTTAFAFTWKPTSIYTRLCNNADLDDNGVVNAMMPEEKLEVTEKKGLKQKLLRKEGEKESKIVLDDKADTTELKQVSNTGKTDGSKQVTEKKEEPKKPEAKKPPKTEVKK